MISHVAAMRMSTIHDPASITMHVYVGLVYRCYSAAATAKNTAEPHSRKEIRLISYAIEKCRYVQHSISASGVQRQ